jgi:predicted metal-binding membrane protein
MRERHIVFTLYITIMQSRAMGVMPGTMGLLLTVYILMWTAMMAAMMLPSVVPLASRYTRLIATRWVISNYCSLIQERTTTYLKLLEGKYKQYQEFPIKVVKIGNY